MPNTESMSTPFSISGRPDYEARLNFVLRGRKPHPWGAALGLKPATITRLKSGQFPDPEKLMPACRVENLSLSWLLFGLGTPYVVSLAVDGADAYELIDERMAEERWNLLITHSEAGWLPVLYQTADLTLADGSILDYRAIQVISGNLKGCEALLRQRIEADVFPAWSSLPMREEEWRRLATGYMGTVELFERERSIQHSFVSDLDFPRLADRIEEGAAPYAGQTSIEREALSIIRQLDRSDQSAALRMLHGLSVKHPPKLLE